MRQNRMYSDFHRFVRVIYRYHRRFNGKEATQDECLELFKIVFPEYYKAMESNDETFKFSDKAVERICKLFAKWKPKGPLSLLCDYVSERILQTFTKAEFLHFCIDIMPVVMRIRKLTERECLRLMDVDEADIDTIIGCGISKSSVYKLAGNSIVVSPLVYLYKNLFITPTKKEGRLIPKQLSLFV